MPNQPAKNTASTSFTLPGALLRLVETKARQKMTNKSDIIRQALMNYLTSGEKAWVMQQMGDMEQSMTLNETPAEYRTAKIKPRKPKP